MPRYRFTHTNQPGALKIPAGITSVGKIVPARAWPVRQKFRSLPPPVKLKHPGATGEEAFPGRSEVSEASLQQPANGMAGRE
ncbi:MAG: hypothetical protein ONB06_12010 [candidate division KSB1 bacterium]|nr:hypothetical protein [candidate division KSB1 bacterium]